MLDWFQERYVSRDEHERIVAYYRKLVAQLHGTICELRGQAEVPDHGNLIEPGQVREPQETRRKAGPSSAAPGDNVIRLDFTRRRA